MSDQMLIIEDEPLLGSELQRHFRAQSWDARLAKSIKEAETLLTSGELDPLIVLSDLNLPDGNGLDLLERLGENTTITGEWIFLTGFGDAPDAVRAMRLGAFEFLTKPADIDRLDLIVAGARRSATAHHRIFNDAARQGKRYQSDAFIGHSEPARQLRAMLNRIAGVPFSGLVINGETGTGKGLVAKIIHHSGPRAAGPFIEVNCAALPRDLLESELFGHEAGAFTGAKGRHKGLMEQAVGGTLFLDEIGEMDLSLQPKLLKALEDHLIRRLGGESEIKVDIQVVAATNRNLGLDVQEGKFRQDLYHRLSVLELSLPALRDRKEDLEELTFAFVDELNHKAKKKVKFIPEKVWSVFASYEWPGNVRELRNVLERSVLLSNGETLPIEWLQLRNISDQSQGCGSKTEANRITLPLDGTMALDDMDRHIIATALESNNYNVMATARALGTTRETLRYRIQKYGLLKRKPQVPN